MHHTCPRHGDALVRHPIDGTLTWRCDRCEGLWLPGAVVQRVVGSNPHWPARDATEPTALRCPDDGKGLRAVDADGIELDWCAHCRGLWLDRGELARILDRKRDDNDDDTEELIEDLLDACDGDGGSGAGGSGGSGVRTRTGARKDADGDVDAPAPAPAPGGGSGGGGGSAGGGGSSASPAAAPGGMPPVASFGPAQQQAALQVQPHPSSTAGFDVERGTHFNPPVADHAATPSGRGDGSSFEIIGDVLSGAGDALGAVLSFVGDVFGSV